MTFHQSSSVAFFLPGDGPGSGDRRRGAAPQKSKPTAKSGQTEKSKVRFGRLPRFSTAWRSKSLDCKAAARKTRTQQPPVVAVTYQATPEPDSATLKQVTRRRRESEYAVTMGDDKSSAKDLTQRPQMERQTFRPKGQTASSVAEESTPGPSNINGCFQPDEIEDNAMFGGDLPEKTKAKKPEKKMMTMTQMLAASAHKLAADIVAPTADKVINEMAATTYSLKGQTNLQSGTAATPSAAGDSGYGDGNPVTLTNFRRRFSGTSALVGSAAGDMDHRVQIVVSGQPFATKWQLLQRLPKSRLARLKRTDHEYDPVEGHWIFYRNTRVFQSVLDFYHIGQLHVPRDMCWELVLEELNFWQIDSALVEKCCVNQIQKVRAENNEAEDLQAAFDKDWYEWNAKGSGEIARRKGSPFQMKIWQCLEDPSTGKGRLWAILHLLLAVLAWLLFVAETSAPFRVWPANMTELVHDNKLHINFNTSIHPLVVFIDIGVIGFFLLELLLRFWACPEKRRFFYQPLNLIDSICVLADTSKVILYAVNMSLVDSLQKNPSTRLALFYVYGVFSMFRVLRIGRIFQSGDKYGHLRVLTLSMFASTREIILLIIVMIVGVITYATLIYVVELNTIDKLQDMVEACWWAIITMTTVGYGDQHPKTLPGKVIAAMCAVTGVVFISLPIPIIAQNFSRYYRFAQDQLKREQLNEQVDQLGIKENDAIIDPEKEFDGPVATVTNSVYDNDAPVVNNTATSESPAISEEQRRAHLDKLYKDRRREAHAKFNANNKQRTTPVDSAADTLSFSSGGSDRLSENWSLGGANANIGSASKTSLGSLSLRRDRIIEETIENDDPTSSDYVTPRGSSERTDVLGGTTFYSPQTKLRVHREDTESSVL